MQDLIEKDQQQRAQALDAHASFIVQAPAGSGKTELLIQRFLTLLNQVNKPEEVLAITFTKKAANEMRLRLLKALKNAMHEPFPASSHAQLTWNLATNVLKRDQQFGWNLLDNPNQLRIQTIDALCTYLTKQLPLLSHFGSQPDIAENASLLYRTAVQEVLLHVEENYEWSVAISKLLLHLDNDLNKLHDLCINLLAKRDQWLPYIHLDQQTTEIKKHLEQQLAAIVNEQLTKLRQLFPSALITETMAIARFAADNIALKFTQQQSELRNLMELPGVAAKDMSAWLTLANLLLTKTGTWRKQLNDEIGFPPLTGIKNPQEKLLHTDYRQRFAGLIKVLNEHEDLRLALQELTHLPKPTYDNNQWDILQSLLMLLKILAAQLRVTFQQFGQIDFIENAQAALLALGTAEQPTDLALALDYQIKHILVDEFQDTSYTQYQLLEKLTNGWETHDGRTLFVVGDPMQSIYRFREAEVGLFIRMRLNGIGAIKLIPLTLARNFRSLSDIVLWNNKHFSAMFPKHNDIATGSVTYSPSITNQTTQQTSQISIQGFANFEDGIQAQAILNLITETRQHSPNDSIAILVRSRGHLSEIIPTLKRANISFRAIDIAPLASRQHIQDLLALTKAMLHPADRIAWLAILRAPWCGLSLADLLSIAGNDAYATIYEQLERAVNVSTDGQTRLERITPILKTKLFERDRYDLRTWIESTWQALGGPASLKEAADIYDAEEFFKLLGKLDQTGQAINLERLQEKVQQLYATTSHDEHLLQIMTIHSAKGLEFDTVILPHLERKMPIDDKSLLLWMERPLMNDKTALLLAPIHKTGSDKDNMYEYISRQQKIKSEYEIERLFYVATTRAKKNLHLLFAIQHGEREFSPEHGSFLKKIWPQIEANKAHIILENQQAQADTQQKITTVVKRPLRRLHTQWTNPIKSTSTQQTGMHKKSSGFSLPDTSAQTIGIVTHRILQLLAQNGLDWWTEKSKDNQLDYIHALLSQRHMPIKQLYSAKNTVFKAIDNTLADSRGQWILQQQSQSKAEFALSTVNNGEVMNLVVDRTFIDANDIRWIIDYKTTAFSKQDLETFLSEEQDKYLEKMQQYKAALQLHDARETKLGLYFPILQAWKEW